MANFAEPDTGEVLTAPVRYSPIRSSWIGAMQDRAANFGESHFHALG